MTSAVGWSLQLACVSKHECNDRTKPEYVSNFPKIIEPVIDAILRVRPYDPNSNKMS